MIDVPTVRSLLSPDGLRDPYAVYDRFRDAQAAGADIGRVVVSFDEVASALTDRALSADRVAGILRPLDAEVLAQCPLVERTLRGIVAFRDPPDHQRVRGLLAKAFSPRMVAEQVAERPELLQAPMASSGFFDDDLDAIPSRRAAHAKTTGRRS